MSQSTTSTIIGVISQKRHYWTEFNRRMRTVDLKKLDFRGDEITAIPLD